MILIDSVIGIEPMSDVQGGISPQNNLLPLASRKTTQIHWHVLSLIHLSSLEAQHYLNFREEEKEVQRWKRMPRSWPQCPKGKTDYSSWSEMIKYIPGKQSWQPVLPCDWELSWTKEHTFSCWVKPIGMSDQGHWVCKRKMWIPFSCCPVSFCFWEWCFSADIPCRDVTSRKKIHLWCSLVAPSCLS